MNPLNIFKKVAGIWRTWRNNRHIPLRLEFVVTDYCNLNCRGCTHYSPLAKKEFEPLEQLRRAAQHLGRVAAKDVPLVYLIGGETLLYPQLPEAMAIMRECFPESEVMIFTNGLILGKMSEEFWNVAKATDSVMAITRYPVKFDYDAVEALCAEHGVRTKVFADRNDSGSFFRFPLDPEKKQNSRLSHFSCYNRGCVSIIGDKIYPCSISACVSHLNAACGTDFRHEEGDWIMVQDVRSAADIKRLRDNPVPFCGYCKRHPQTVEYGPSKRVASEWVD